MGAYNAAADASGPIESRNPATGEVLGQVPDQGADEVRAAVARARAAQAGWGALPVRERAARVGAFRDEIVRRARDLCEWRSQECGKPPAEALTAEVAVVADA